LVYNCQSYSKQTDDFIIEILNYSTDSGK